MRKQSRQYNAEDGLKVLEYLGIRNITKEEKKVFRKEWKRFYDGELIFTTWTLYSETLPFTLGDRDRGSFALQMRRDSDFDYRLKITGLDKKLKKGKPLEEILKKGPYIFIKECKVSDLLEGKVNPYSAHGAKGYKRSQFFTKK